MKRPQNSRRTDWRRSLLSAATLTAALWSYSLNPLNPLWAEPLPPALQAANADLQAGRADQATAKLNAALQADPNSAAANNLLCRVEYSLQQFDAAADRCQKAVSASPQTARYHLWLARALGERASRAGFMSAFSLAKKSRAEFEAAVQADPRDADALADLGEFYVEAPGVVGGGIDKAIDIAAKLEAVDSARGHELRASVAEKDKDLSKAEQEFKAALQGASHPAQAWMALAGFYRHQQRWAEMESAVKSGAEAARRDKRAAVPLSDGASTLARAGRSLDLAVKLYESYIDSPDKTEEAPAFEALTRLARLRIKMGDKAGAEQDKAAALALAHEYKPAQTATDPDKDK